MREADVPESLRAARELMRDFGAPWCVAGGWALDLYLGRVTREHADVELAIFRDDQTLLHRHLRGWTIDKVVNGSRLPWPADERLALPVHEIHARSSDDPPMALEFLMNERQADHWDFRRDARVTLPIARAILAGVLDYPVLCPEIVLLYKSNSSRAKDEADLIQARDALDGSHRAWLRLALETCRPGHPWLDALSR